MALAVVTMKSPGDHPGYTRLVGSAERHGWPLITVTSHNYGGWGSKVLDVAAWARIHKQYDLILYTDGYDTFFVREFPGEQFFYDRFPAGVYSAEKNCWPDPSIADRYPTAASEWKYLNAGQWLLKRGDFMHMADYNPIRPSDNDQPWHARLFLSGQYAMRLDDKCELFQSVAFLAPGDFDTGGAELVNLKTGSRPYIVHGNGGTDLSPYEKYA